MDVSTDPAAAPSDAPAATSDDGELSLLGIMERQKANAPAEDLEADTVDDAEEEEDAEGEPEEKPAEEPKAEEPKPLNLSAVKAHVAQIEARAEQLSGELAEAHHSVAQYDAALQILQADNQRLVQALRDAKLIDERELKLREYELQGLARQEMERLQAKHADDLKATKEEAVFNEKVRFYERAIPRALKDNELVSEAELCSAIERLPPGAEENIPALAKALNEAKLAAARRSFNAARKARRALPPSSGGTAPPPDFELNARGFADLMTRARRPGR